VKTVATRLLPAVARTFVASGWTPIDADSKK
jgi:hypothetical protein